MGEQTILVTGGCGYIGSHAVLELKERGYEPVVVDNFFRSSRHAAEALHAPLYEGDIGDERFMREILSKVKPAAVMHFAAFAYVNESVGDPSLYYLNNVGGTLRLLAAMAATGVRNLIFSSTCATYGEVTRVPITEETPQVPINPYGRSKLMVEQVLRDYEAAYGLRYIAFRYFNAAGAHASGVIGERHDPETHLIPLTIAAAQGKGELTIFGDDYPTLDGTCIRDYVHVSDIAAAHVLGIDYLRGGGESGALNLGTGKGYSVRQVIETVERISGSKVPYVVKSRRPGDPPELVAEPRRAREVLSWQPRFSSLEQIVATAWKWHTSSAMSCEVS